MNSGNMLRSGDDIGVLVFDPGHHSFRIGFAQDDGPKSEIPSIVGVHTEATGNTVGKIDHLDVDKRENNCMTSSKVNTTYYVDTPNLFVPRKNLEIQSYMKDGMIEDWDLFEKVLDYAYVKCIQSESANHPVLFSESAWNVKNKREKLTEIMFEKYKVPAFYLVKNVVLAAYANGRTTGLVVDSGATHTSAVPIQDGYVLQPAISKSTLGGDFLRKQCRQYLQDNNIDIIPSYLIGTKEVIGDRERSKWVRSSFFSEVTQSWHNYAIQKAVQDFQTTVLRISEQPYDEKIVSQFPIVHYEFPDGYHQDFGSERFKIPEALFNPNSENDRGCLVDNSILGISDIVTTSVGMCNNDIRSLLYGNVIITGGNSCISGFPNRLYRDLSLRIPGSIKLKMVSSSSCSGRKFGAWIGGSILASLGTFQQMWISAQEYEETGKNQVELKCP